MFPKFFCLLFESSRFFVRLSFQFLMEGKTLFDVAMGGEATTNALNSAVTECFLFNEGGESNSCKSSLELPESSGSQPKSSSPLGMLRTQNECGQ